MTRRPPAIRCARPPGAHLALLVGSFACLGGRAALAAGPPCSLAIEADASLQERWPEVVDDVKRSFVGRDDVDACARVDLTAEGRSVRIRTVLPDGRAASRTVARREDVVPTLEALLLLPRRAEPTSQPALESNSTPALATPLELHVAEHPSFSAPALVARDAPSSAPGSNAPGHLRIELSVVTDARIGDGQASVGLGALSFLDLGGWIAGFGGRADRYERLTGSSSGAALELGAFGGRRFRVMNLAVDLYGGPGVALRGGGTTTSGSPSGSTSSQSNIGVVPRALLAVRVNFAPSKTMHAFVGLEGDLGLASAPDATSAPGAELPVWTFGLALGATVGTQ